MGRAPTILALARNTGGFFHGQILAGLLRQVDMVGGRVVVALTLDPGTDGKDALNLPTFNHPVAWDDVDAVVSVALAAGTTFLDRAVAEGKPVVLASHSLPGFDVPVALPDNHGGIRRPVEHLIGHGHTRIGFVGSMDQHDSRERRAAYLATMAEHGLPAGDDLFFAATTSPAPVARARPSRSSPPATDRQLWSPRPTSTPSA